MLYRYMLVWNDKHFSPPYVSTVNNKVFGVKYIKVILVWGWHPERDIVASDEGQARIIEFHYLVLGNGMQQNIVVTGEGKEKPEK